MADATARESAEHFLAIAHGLLADALDARRLGDVEGHGVLIASYQETLQTARVHAELAAVDAVEGVSARLDELLDRMPGRRG